MPERAVQIVKLVCLLLAALLVYELAQVARRINPLSGMVMPALPTLAAEKTNAIPAAERTNSIKLAAQGTNKPADLAATNSPAPKSTNGAESNLVVAAPVPKTETNAAAGTNITLPPAIAGTNDSNVITTATNATNGTNAAALAKIKRKGTNGPSAMMRSGMGGPRGTAVAELPPEIRARIDRIYESEILMQVMRPLPMGLIGIAGEVAFLRTASGQTGLIKEGETLGDLKLLQIGTNRVVVEQDGQKKELTIFDGYGGESLLPEREKPK